MFRLMPFKHKIFMIILKGARNGPLKNHGIQDLKPDFPIFEAISRFYLKNFCHDHHPEN
jgi:hypothetical protein